MSPIKVNEIRVGSDVGGWVGVWVNGMQQSVVVVVVVVGVYEWVHCE